MNAPVVYALMLTMVQPLERQELATFDSRTECLIAATSVQVAYTAARLACVPRERAAAELLAGRGVP